MCVKMMMTIFFCEIDPRLCNVWFNFIISLYYFDEIIQADNEVKPYITQSWINFTKENGHHHLHAHANSIVTAVLYIETTEGDCIKFHASDYRAHYFKPKKVNNFNASEFTVKVQKG